MVAPARSIDALAGKYRVLAQLGQGGTADVSLAVASGPQGFSKLVVLKSMKPQFRKEPGFPEMFMTEARLAARLAHPNIVQTNEVFDFEGLPVIVMEYLQGQTLSAVLAKGATGGSPMPLGLRLRALSECLAALEYSHDLTDFDDRPLGLVHRDVSPHNLFLTYDGQVKLLDFGIAKLEHAQVETATGVIKGKLRYMPPEQITGEGIDRRADIYAVGVMLFEAITNTRLWEGASDANIMHAVLNDKTPAPRDFAEVNPELERICLRALHHDPEARFSTAGEMREELEAYLAKLDAPSDVRSLGKFVSTSFEEEQERTKRLVREQMSRVVALGEGTSAYAPLDLVGDDSSSGSLRIRKTPPATRSARTTQQLLGLAVVGGVSGVLLMGIWQFKTRQEAPPKPSVIEQVPVSNQKVKLRITGFPAEAELRLDGDQLPSNPFVREFPSSATGSLELVVSAPGYQPAIRRIRLDQDADVVVTLRRLPPQGPPASSPDTGAMKPKIRPKPASPPIPVDTAASSPSSPSCDPPYYIDERGVKKFRAGCL